MNIRRQFRWVALLGALLIASACALLLYAGCRLVGLSIGLSAAIATWSAGVPTGVVLGLLIDESPLLEACLGIALGAAGYTLVTISDAIAAIVVGMMMAAICGLGIWIGFGIAAAYRRRRDARYTEP